MTTDPSQKLYELHNIKKQLNCISILEIIGFPLVYLENK